MIFGRPLPFKEALESQEARRYLPTGLGSADLEQIEASLLRRAMFSAKVSDFEHLDLLGSTISDVLSGHLDVATARLRVKQHLWRTGYQAPADKAGTVEDFASDARTNLQINTNVEMMRGLGNHIQGQQEDVLDMWPAQRLVRVIETKAQRQWSKRWDAAGGPDNGMVALKNDPIWVEISRFGNPYPPFDYNSGMGVEDVTRRQAMALGLIDLNTPLFPDNVTGNINQGVQATYAVKDPRMKRALEKSGIGRFNDAGVFVLVDDDEAPLTNREFSRDEQGRFASTNAGAVAVEVAMSTKTDVMNAMSRPETGPIDFRWGDDGKGIAHIIKRGDAREKVFNDGLTGAAIVRRMPDVIASGTITENHPNKMIIEHEGFRAVLAKQWNGKPSAHWLLSGYDVSAAKGRENKKGNR